MLKPSVITAFSWQTCKAAQSCKRILWFVRACNKAHSLCLSLTLPNDHLCQDLSGHCALLCSPWAALTCLRFPPSLEAASPEPQVRTGHLWKSGGSHSWLPACSSLSCFNPRQLLVPDSSLFPGLSSQSCTDMASSHTALCRTAYSSVCTQVIQLF